MRQSKQNYLRVHRRLAEVIEEIDDSAYDIVLIDCPPNFNIVTKTAIVSSDFILVPTRPDYLSTLGIDYLIKNVNDLISDYNDYAKENVGSKIEAISPATLGVLFNMIQVRSGEPISAQANYMRQVRMQSGLFVFKSYIKENKTIFANAPETGVPVVLNGYGAGTYKNVVDGLEEVATEFKSQIGLS